MNPFDDWDADYINEIPTVDESLEIEKKASAKFIKDGKPDKEAKSELAKQVCAIANSGQGFLVYGIADDGNLDRGVPRLIGNQPTKDWLEAMIPTLLAPPIHVCEAKLIDVPGHHDADQGVLVVSIPASERPPRMASGWTTSKVISCCR